MKWFKCFVAGENFPGELINEDHTVGFDTTRFVQAESAEKAEIIVLAKLKREESLRLPADVSPSAEAKVYFEDILGVSSNEIPETQIGFTFYVMGS